MLRPVKIFVLVAVLSCWITVSSHAEKSSLAIFNFRPTNIEAMGYNGDILYALISALGMEGSVELMPRRVMEELLFQAGLTQSDNPDTAQKAGKVLGTNFVLYGQVTKKGSNIHSKMYLMDIQNRRIIRDWALVFSGREAILDQIPKFARELIETIENRKQYSAPVSEKQAALVDIRNLKARSKGKVVELSWEFDPSQPIGAFNVYRSENSGGPYQLLGNVTRNIYEDTSIKRGRTYYYRIGILLHSGMENKSKNTAEIRNAGEKLPYPPLIISNKGHIRRTEIKFVPSLQNDQEGFRIKYYEIMRKKNPDDQWVKIRTLDSSKKSEYEISFVTEDKNLEDGKTYIYSIVSVDSRKRRSPFSDQFQIQTVQRPVLVLDRDGLLRKNMFRWQAMSNVEGYFLYRKPGNGSWERVGKITGANRDRHTDDRELRDGTNYQYYLTAYDEREETGPSKAVRAKTKDLPPFPENINAKSGMVKSVWLSWTPVNDPDVGGYAIYRGTQKRSLEYVTKVKGHRSLSYMDKGSGFTQLRDGTDYYYAVISYNLFGAEGPSPPAVHARTKPVPSGIGGLSVSSSGSSITVKWDRNPEPDITEYIIFRNRNGGYWSKIRNTGPDETVYNDYDLKPKSAYTYKIIAQDRDGLKSEPVESEPIASPIIKSN